MKLLPRVTNHHLTVTIQVLLAVVALELTAAYGMFLVPMILGGN